MPRSKNTLWKFVGGRVVLLDTMPKPSALSDAYFAERLRLALRSIENSQAQDRFDWAMERHRAKIGGE